MALAVLLIAALGSGACAGHNLNRDLKDDPRILVRDWTYQTHGDFAAGDKGFEYSNPVFFENTLLVGNQSTGLVSLYPKLLLKRWTLPIRGGVVSEIVVDKGSAYFGGGDGYLYSVNAENGRVNWRYDLHNPIVSRPTIEGGRLFLTTTDDTVYAFDAGTGKWLWHYRRRSASTATIRGASTPLVDGNEVIAGLSDGFLVALNLNDGQLKWERKLHQGTKFTDVDAHPVLEQGMLYVPSYDGSLYAMKREGGETLWRFDAGGSKAVQVEGDRLYLPSTEGAIYAIQKQNAKVLWKFVLDSGTPTQMIVTDRYVIVGSSFQYLYVIDKNTGAGLYRFNVGYGSGFSGAPAYDPVSQRLYLLSGAGNLYAFRIQPPVRKIWPRGSTDPYRFQ